MVQSVCKWSNVNPQLWLYNLAHHIKDGVDVAQVILGNWWVTIGDCQYDNNEGVETAICEWLRMLEPDFYNDGILHSSQDEKMC